MDTNLVDTELGFVGRIAAYFGSPEDAFRLISSVVLG